MRDFDIVLNSKSGFSFYVIDDLRKAAFPIHYFQSFKDALGKYEKLSDDSRMTTLGLERGTYRLDIMQRVNGNDVLCGDYKNQNLFEPMRPAKAGLRKIIAHLIDENIVQWTYSNDYFDRTRKGCPVVVPLGNNSNGFDDSYCADKRLKTVSGFGFDSINQLFVSGHGWVDYRDVREEPQAFEDDGFLFVEGVNVNYSFKMNLSGVDGQLDVSPHDFARMLQDINKEFSLKVYDELLGNSYIVESHSELKDAVRAWYELPEEVTAHVAQTVGYSYQQILFNGMDDAFEEIPFEVAAEMYDFVSGEVENLIEKAEGKAGKALPAERSKEFELERGSV